MSASHLVDASSLLRDLLDQTSLTDVVGEYAPEESTIRGAGCADVMDAAGATGEFALVRRACSEQ
jgi:hypothetical protein